MAQTKRSDGLTAEERQAVKDRAAERRADQRATSAAEKAAAERQQLLDAIAAMPPHDRALAERVHELVSANAPELAPKTWYGMPAWAKDGQVVCFFQDAAKFKARYATFGFNVAAHLDDGAMWPISFAVLEIGDAEADRIAELVRRSVSGDTDNS